MEQIFLSYRSGDSEDVKSELKQAIDREFGDGTAYEFSQENEAGEDFPTRLSLAISRAKVILAVIGPAWKAEAERRQKEGGPDWVRTELEDGFRARVPIVPIVIDRNHPFSLLDSDPLIHRLNRLHSVQLDTIQGQGLQEFVTGLAKRFKISKSNQDKKGHMSALHTILGLERLHDPRRLLLHGPMYSLARLTEATITLILVSAASYVAQGLLDPLPGNIKAISLDMALWSCSSYLILALLLTAWMIFPKLIYRDAPLIYTMVAAFGAVTVYVILLTVPSLLLLTWVQIDPGALQFMEQITYANLDPQKIIEQFERIGDFVTYAGLKIGLILILGFIFILIFAIWYFRLTTMLQKIWRTSLIVRCYWLIGIIILLAFPYRNFIIA